MIIKNKANNGVITLALKEYSELSNEERQALRIPATNTIEDYANFYVNRKKDGSLVRVWGKNFSDKMNEKIEHRQKYEADLVDAWQARLGEKDSQEYKSAKKRINRIAKDNEK